MKITTDGTIEHLGYEYEYEATISENDYWNSIVILDRMAMEEIDSESYLYEKLEALVLADVQEQVKESIK